jgi:DNA polymerase
MQRAVRHDLHKMRAFVRFREVRTGGESEPWYVAWFEPAHHIVEENAPFFVDRFANMRWSILTPDRCAHWDGAQLSITGGVSRSEAPTEDATEGLWLQYYAHIFNPARVKARAMQAEMPKHYWKNLPETAIIPALLREAPARMERMIARSDMKRTAETDWHPAEPPATNDLADLAAAAAKCTACPLYKNATQTVFGEGRRDAHVVLLGEQPGDQEDRTGRPFVGPAGLLLNRALADAGLPREECYVTNTVKHFKWEPRGKRRLHQTPNARDVAACRPWFEAELNLLKPRILICLGATAAKAIFGPSIRVTIDRGHFRETPWSAQTLVTVHPSSLLRAPSEEEKERNYHQFVQDLKVAARASAKRG